MKFYPAERLNMGISAGAVAASCAVATPEFAGSLALGAAIEAVNFRFLHRAGEGLFEGVINGSGPWVSVLFMRFGLLAVFDYYMATIEDPDFFAELDYLEQTQLPARRREAQSLEGDDRAQALDAISRAEQFCRELRQEAEGIL